MRNQELYTNINWMNELKESNLPYDFTVMENGKHKYIEVKGTPSKDKELFPISQAEWRLLFENGSDYIIFRVYGVGSEQYRFERIDNPAEKIQKGLYLPSPLSLQL